ncbi:MAG: leucine-rich repeat domain-containing protein [Salinivirgaceae bacterium]|nr:leucine-rich repeat domain-containing protein [Salinivirgaceae bacterium]
MKRIFTLLFAAMLAGQVWADDFTIGKLYYTVTDETNHYVSVSRASNYDTPSGDLVIPESVTDPESNVKYTVTAIANYAFHSCADMTSVTIPGTVTTIGMSAFYNCSGLTTVSLPSSITEIKFDDAFAGCISLASINVAEGNANYASEDGVLFNNDKTRLLYYPASKTGSTYSIPGTVTTISSSAFENCGNLTSITIPNSVSNIGTSAFKNCANLTSITIPESVFTLGNYAFYGCVSLTEINVASGNRNYSSEDGVLFNSSKTKLMCYPACKASSAYTVPESVTSIDEAAFYGCSNLKLVVIPNTVTSLGDGIFQNCASLESATLPNSITYIPAVTFGGCTNLTSIEIPSTVTFIGNSAFSKCGLTTLEIPRSVTEISSFAFQDCKALTTVLIPISVSDIGMNAFKGCSNASFNCEASEKPDDWSSSWNYDNRPVVWGYGSSSKTWKVTLSANNSSYGSVSGGGTVKDGAKVTITATPAEGYKFVKWSNGLTTATATITVTSDLNLVAEFAIIGSIVESELQYEITSDKTVQVIKSADYTELTDIVIPETVEIDGKTYTVTSIGKDAFEYCNKITNVSIPNTVVEISSYAFFNCDNLISMVIPNSVTHIGHGVFYGCDNLTSVNIPNSVISFDNQVFTNCQKLTEINVASDNSHFSSEEGVLFNKDKTELMYFPAGKTGEYSIPNTVTTIADEAFGYCYGLESVNIPNSVKIIDEDAFISTSLTTVNIPDGVKTIGHGAFGNCYYLESATISKTVTELSPMSFYGCSNLTRIDVASGNQNYASDAGVVFNKDKTEIISFPAGKIDTSYTIPNSVTKIGKYAFYNCDKLESITIPESVTSIGDCAFENCDRLTFITIPNSVTSICDYAFENCDNLESIILSESISNIDRNVFARRNSLVYNEFGNGCYLGTANNPYFALIKAKSTDITSCEIHDNCKIIAEGAFGDCNNLQYNEFDGVLYLGNTENPYLLLIKA